MKFNLARWYLNLHEILAITIDSNYIRKSKKTHIDAFWSGYTSSMKHGLEIMGLALVDVYINSCMMLRPSDSIYWRIKTTQHDSRATLHSGHQALQEGFVEGHRYC